MTGLTTLKELKNGKLEISLTKEGKEELQELLRSYKMYSDDEILFELLKDHFGNGYTNLTGQVGLTNSFIIGRDVDYTEEGKMEITEDSKVWWFPNYMVSCYINILERDGKILFILSN